MAGGDLSRAFDDFFGPSSKLRIDVGIDGLKKMVSKFMVGKACPDDALNGFIDYITSPDRINAFTKTKFVAALSHLIITRKPAIANYFKE